MIALYTVLSPCVFAFRCKRLQRRVKKYYRCRIRGLLSKLSIHSSGKSTSESNGSFHGYGGALDKQDIALLQVKHKLMLSHHSEATALNSEPKRFEFSPKDLTPKENEKLNQQNDKILTENKETIVFSEQQNINQNLNKRRMNFFRKTQISVVNEDEAEIEAEIWH